MLSFLGDFLCIQETPETCADLNSKALLLATELLRNIGKQREGIPSGKLT